MINKPLIIYKKRRRLDKPAYLRNSTWKIAYADFVTAMMAFFLLLWLLSVSSQETLKGVAEYFTAAKSISDKAGLGLEGGADANIEDGIGAPHSASSSLLYGSPSRGRRIDQARRQSMMSGLEKEHFLSMIKHLQQSAELKDFARNINLDLTKEGLQIQIMDSEDRAMFKPNTYELQPYMRKILTIIGDLIKNQPNYIAISGHTASPRPFDNAATDCWNLSSQRANEVRKFLASGLIKADQVIKILGVADKEPYDYRNPYSVKNIRIDITLLHKNSVNVSQQPAPDTLFK